MNTLIFLGGAGCGALVAVVFIISAMRFWARNDTLTLSALVERNKISECQVVALERIAESNESLVAMVEGQIERRSVRSNS